MNFALVSRYKSTLDFQTLHMILFIYKYSNISQKKPHFNPKNKAAAFGFHCKKKRKESVTVNVSRRTVAVSPSCSVKFTARFLVKLHKMYL